MNEGMNDATSAMSQHASPQEHSTYVLSTDKERFGSTQRHGWNRAWAWSWGVLSMLTLLSTSPAWAQETVCARIKIEIKQELTLERQAFDAEMKINNNTDTGVIENDAIEVKITDIMVTPAQPRRLVDLVLADGQTITTTDGHPFNTPEGWRDAILLKKGGKLLLKGDGDSDREVEIASVTHRTQNQTTYNLEVANAHTFFVGVEGVLVHNGNGAYFITFSDGCWYAGKGDKDRMRDSIRERSRPGRTVVSALHWPASSTDESYSLEDKLIEQAGEICDLCSLNERNSPGKKRRGR